MLDRFRSEGFTDIMDVNLNEELKDLQNLIYFKTKSLLVKHDENLSISEKINLKFQEIPKTEFWASFMGDINNSNELKQLICSKGIVSTFNKIFKDPKIFEICTFRARFPSQKKVVYDWHQDEGTWFLSKNKNLLNKFPATLWFSINGANSEDSIQLVKSSHKKKLHRHKYVKDQGFFNIDGNYIIDPKKIVTIETKESQCVIFHPLTLHRSIPQTKLNFRPRYSVDIRYYDTDFRPNFKTDILFKLKRIFNIIN